jgi:hypothetical protein
MSGRVRLDLHRLLPGRLHTAERAYFNTAPLYESFILFFLFFPGWHKQRISTSPFTPDPEWTSLLPE